MSSRPYKRLSNQGFSILEMMVVLAVIMIVTAIVLSSMPSFRDNISLDLVASQVATIIREGQIYGVSQKQAISKQNLSYGLAFVINSKNFVLYADSLPAGNPNNIFDGEKEIEQNYSLPGDIKIVSLKASDGTAITTLNIYFQKLYPEPKFFIGGPGVCGILTSCEASYSHVDITLHSDRLKRDKIIQIWKNGQIAVTNPKP